VFQKEFGAGRSRYRRTRGPGETWAGRRGRSRENPNVPAPHPARRGARDRTAWRPFSPDGRRSAPSVRVPTPRAFLQALTVWAVTPQWCPTASPDSRRMAASNPLETMMNWARPTGRLPIRPGDAGRGQAGEDRLAVGLAEP